MRGWKSANKFDPSFNEVVLVPRQMLTSIDNLYTPVAARECSSSLWKLVHQGQGRKNGISQ